MTAAPTQPRIDKAHYAAARLQCRSLWPDLFFATHLLPLRQRSAIYASAAVVSQLRQIVTSCESGECGACSTVGQGQSCAGGQSPMDERRAVCVAVLDHLWAGKPTGKPELDGFASVVAAVGLDRSWFDPYAGALAELESTRRFATWKRLCGVLERQGSVGLAAARVLGVPATDLGDDRWRRQVLAWAAGIGMTRLLLSIGDDMARGLIRLPLDDLVRFGVSESDLKDAVALAGHARWAELMAFQTQRVRNLFRGGGQWLSLVPDSRSRRAGLLFTSLHEALLDRIDAARGDVFSRRITLDFWSRLRRIGAAIV